MSAKNKRAAAPAPAPSAPQPSASIAPAGEPDPAPFHQRHPAAANAIFAVFCLYVAALWLLALDQTFHWGIFGP